MFTEVIHEYLMMYGEVCSGDLLLLLLQIDVQGRLNRETKVRSAFRSNKIIRIQDLTF